MTTESPRWRRELKQIRAEHRAAMVAATESLRRVDERAFEASVALEKRWRESVSESSAEQRTSVLLPANEDRRQAPEVLTGDRPGPRSWLV